MEALLGFISIAAAKKEASRLLFHPISGFLPKTKFQKNCISCHCHLNQGGSVVVMLWFSSPNFDTRNSMMIL